MVRYPDIDVSGVVVNCHNALKCCESPLTGEWTKFILIPHFRGQNSVTHYRLIAQNHFYDSLRMAESLGPTPFSPRR